MLVIVTDQGEVFVYIGTIPAECGTCRQSSAWAKPVAGVDSVVKLGLIAS